MVTSCGGWCWHLGSASLLAISGAITFSGDCVLAQVTPDGTLGAESSVVTPTNVNDQPGEQIDGGVTRGANLFHSFEQFSIPTGAEAFFNNALDIQNIISRVTGASISNIDGLLRANGTANLFLLNPNGINFGANARLSIGGSFVGSTASAVNFADGTSFSATVPQATPLLTVSVPIGLQFGGVAGSIRNQSRVRNNNRLVGLQVLPGKTLALLGGDVTLDSGYLTASSGRIELGGVSEAGTVGLTVEGNSLRLNYPNEVARADISLTNRARAIVSGQGGGDIQVEGRRVRLTEGSRLELQSLGSTPAGTLSVTASELVELIGVERYTADQIDPGGLIADPRATGRGGNITVETRQLIIRDGARISTTTRGQGAGGNLTVRASESVELIETSQPLNNIFRSGLFAGVGSGSTTTGNGGNLFLETRQLSIRNGGTVTVSANTSSEGSSGTATIRASESIELSGISANARGDRHSRVAAQSSGNGDAGDLTIETGQLTVRDAARVSVSSTSSGNAGNLKVQARSIQMDSQGTLTAETASGDGGNITLQDLDLLLMRRNSNISTASGGTGNGGNINIEADFIVALPSEDSNIIADAIEGQGGNIDITTQGIFGIQPREQQTLESDITASSQVGIGGAIAINNPDVDPSQGLVILPAEVVDASNQIAQACPADGENNFIITGRGGLPPNPNEPLFGDNVLTEWNTLDSDAENRPDVENRSSATPSTNPTTESANTTIVEANGWMTNDKGEVILTATAPTATFNIPWVPKSDCNTPEQKT